MAVARGEGFWGFKTRNIQNFNKILKKHQCGECFHMNINVISFLLFNFLENPSETNPWLRPWGEVST